MLKRLYLVTMMALTIVCSSLSFAQPASAACPPDNFMGINAWYKGLQDPKTCSVVLAQGAPSDKLRIFIMTIALNVIQAGFAIVAYVTVFFIIKGGFLYMTSTGSQDGMTAAKKTITNAVIGLVIAVFASSIVNAVAGVIR